jgi:hypothetical protein
VYSQQPAPTKVFQAFLINILTAILGFLTAYWVLKEYNEGAQKQIILDGVKSQFSLIERHVLATQAAVLASANWTDTIIRVQEIPYDELFAGARKLGLVVQGWDKWPEDRASELRSFVARGGLITVVLHDPQNQDVLNTMRTRWPLQDKDCKAEIRNTEINFREAVPKHHHERLKFVYRPNVIWYCLLRFEYKDPTHTVYIVSPYAHRDYSVNKIPAVILRRQHFESLTDFFEHEWVHLSQDVLTKSGPLIVDGNLS